MKDKYQNLAKIPITKRAFESLGESCGVYIYWKNAEAIYIGKAKNLKNRLKSYLSAALAPKTVNMLARSDSVSSVKTISELESLLLEAELIKNFQPRFNSVSKDDKHPLYIIITKEPYPRVMAARKLTAEGVKLKANFGPFPSSGTVYSVLRSLRKIFPYSDHKLGRRPCMYSHLGLCNPCPNEISKIQSGKDTKILSAKYRKNVGAIKNILSGKINSVKKNLYEEMQGFSKEEKFEEAKKVREQLEKLAYITQPVNPAEGYLENPNLSEDIREGELKELVKILSDDLPSIKHTGLGRIECFDVAHLYGTSPTASMVTFVNGEPEKKFYRHFKIRQKKGQDDLLSMREVAKRRINHLDAKGGCSDWGKPDLIIVDGGRAQVAVFWSEASVFRIPIIGLAKQFETLVIPRWQRERILKFKEVRLNDSTALRLLQRIRNEAHRFARRLHHQLVTKTLLDKTY